MHRAHEDRVLGMSTDALVVVAQVYFDLRMTLALCFGRDLADDLLADWLQETDAREQEEVISLLKSKSSVPFVGKQSKVLPHLHVAAVAGRRPSYVGIAPEEKQVANPKQPDVACCQESDGTKISRCSGTCYDA